MRIAFYGDDFTGATDTLATATQGGLRTLLFLRPPTPARLAAAGELDCLGIAGASRSMAPAEMHKELAPIAACFAELDAPVVHYKTCSTFDSAPETGNIAAAIQLLGPAIGARFVPIVAGQPNLGRYCVFGNLFAAAEQGGPMFRIDRHPTMARHPVTPMTEADLRLHLARQGLIGIGNIPYTAYGLSPEALADRIAAAGADSAGAVLFDVSRAEDLAVIGRTIWQQARAARVLAVGPSGVTQALAPSTGSATPRVARAQGPVFIMAGSLSPVTRAQITAATGFARLSIDAARLAARESAYLEDIVRQCASALAGGRDLIAHTMPSNAHAKAAGLAIATATGELVARLLRVAPLRRFGVAGGDTSSWILRALDVWALAHVGHLAPGVALCRIRADDPALDGVEVMLKGGQMGSRDLFELLRAGT
jgi:uncharacterized protein YgbK (DUF1537 family)